MTMTIRIVHLADLHLDIPLSSYGRDSRTSNARREGLREALKRAVHLAKQCSADAMTIGGDLFEAEHVSPDTIQFLHQQFADAAPLDIYVSPGNHDPYTHSSPYAYTGWSPNVHIFREAHLAPMELKEGWTLWGAAHDSASFTAPLLFQFKLPDPTRAILLLHGTDRALTLGNEKGAFCPFSESEVRASGFSLALLGHIHHRRLHPEESPLLCYPGSPEPLGFGEEEGHSIVQADWTGNGWHVEAHDISHWACRKGEIDVTDFGSRDAVIERIRGQWAETYQQKRCVARIGLTGQPAKSLDLDLQAIRSALLSEYEDVFLDDFTDLPFDTQALRQDSTVTGAFVRRLLKEIDLAKHANDEPRQRILERALRYGLMALEHREVRSP